jgi:glycine C-acetyltransferase
LDIFQKIEKNMGELGQFAEIGHGYFTYPKLEGEIGPWMTFRGKKVLNWSLNNYIGLGNHPDVRKVDAESAARWGLAYPMGSRMLTGNSDNHEAFERNAAEFLGKEDCYLLNFGYQGMLSIIQSLTDRRDVIVYDQLAHACIMDGMMLSLAKRFVYRHNDMDQFEDRLEKAQRIVEKTGGGILVITEGVFGMKGDTGRLDEIVKRKAKYNFRLLVDDAHGFGVMGPTGAGTAEHYGVSDQIDLVFNTFAKSMAMVGAFVAGPKKIINFLRYNMRSQIYAKSLPMPLVEGAIKRLEMLRTMPELRERLWKIVNYVQKGLRDRGFDIGITNSPVTPVYLKGGTDEAGNMIIDLRENHGIFVSVVTYPVVERGELMLRIIPTADHTMEDVDITLAAFEKVKENLNNGLYKAKVANKTV